MISFSQNKDKKTTSDCIWFGMVYRAFLAASVAVVDFKLASLTLVELCFAQIKILITIDCKFPKKEDCINVITDVLSHDFAVWPLCIYTPIYCDAHQNTTKRSGMLDKTRQTRRKLLLSSSPTK